MQIYDVKINGLQNPLGFFYDLVRCSWKVKKSEGKKQDWVKIEVAKNEDFEESVYSKQGEQLNSVAEQLDFKLESYTRYFVRITVKSDAGETAVCDNCYFETAKQEDSWQAEWIGMQKKDNFHPIFHKKFEAPKKVKNARLYISGLGLFEAYINEKKAGNDLLAPFVNDYEDMVQYCTYDVSDLIYTNNEIKILLGNGWYKGRYGFVPPDPEKKYLCIAELRLIYEDGSIETVKTDESWTYCGSQIEVSDIYDGETQNYLLWEGKGNPWKQAVVEKVHFPLTARYSLPLREMEELTVKEVIHTPAGETVLDFGQNFAGYVECSQTIPKGMDMLLEFGEILQNGNFYHENYRTAKSVFKYISDGKARIIRTYFTFFGFRYAKVSGLNEIHSDCFKGWAVYSEMQRTGYIVTGNKKINRLIENSVWGLKSNSLDIPTDCPQRDERLGWTGDAQVFCRTAGYHMDTRGFYRKFLHDLRLDQLKNNGKVAVYYPNFAKGLTSCVWSDIATFLPKMLYEYYGDRFELEEHYPMMKNWVDWITSEDEKQGNHHLWDFGFHFADWLALDGATEQSMLGRTDSYFVASAYYYASVKYVADAAKILGFEEEQKYRKIAEKIRQAFLYEYYTPSGRLAIDTQTGYLIALKFGLYHNKEKIINGLVNRIKKDCYRIKGGFVGATMMNEVLVENGLERLAYDFLFFENFPGWLYQVNLGATTIWERWNSVLPDGKISGTGMNSLNHYSFGSVVEFLYRHTAGIIPTEPGFKKVRFEPKPDIRFGSFKCHYNSAAGEYVSNWDIKENGTLSFHFEVPFGAEAVICLPDSDMEEIVVTTGSYDYAYLPNKDYRALFDGESRMEYMIKNSQVVDILKKYVPNDLASAMTDDVEAQAMSINDIQKKAALFGAPADCYQALIEELKKCLWNTCEEYENMG